jgi:DNA-binding XRE family transcriptional regulator
MSGSSELSSKEIRHLRRKAGLSQEKLAQVLDISWPSISRWEREQASPRGEARLRLRRLNELVQQIGNALTPEDIWRFLDTRQTLLKGHRPAELLHSDYGFHGLHRFECN